MANPLLEKVSLFHTLDEPSVYIVLLAKLLKQATPAQVDLKRQIIQVLINLASQSHKAKN